MDSSNPLPYAPGQPGPSVRLDGFVMGFTITDLALGSLRLLLALLGAAMMVIGGKQVNLGPGSPMFVVGLIEVTSGIGVGIFAITADLLILLRKPVGIKLGWVNVGFTGLNILAAVGVSVVQAREMGVEGPKLVGYIFGAGFVFLIRIGVCVLYTTALRRASGGPVSAGP
jgi:hypothetical protein